MNRNSKAPGLHGYMIVEALVYAGVSILLLGVAFAAMYRCIESSVALRRSADDLARALHAGERWRADVRAARGPIKVEKLEAGQILYLQGTESEIAYRAADGVVSRRVGSGPWTRVLENVNSSNMKSDPRQTVPAWRWELQLQTRAKTSRIRPLFTFTAVPGGRSTP